MLKCLRCQDAAFILGLKNSTGAHGAEIEFQIARMKKSTHSEAGQKVKCFLWDGLDIFFFLSVMET